jgi:ferredoxin--NADP+ reductase
MKYKIAIVGAGPAGYFTAQAFQRANNKEHSFSIDMIERLPTPWGLIRSGVAPDHPKIKTVSKVFEKIARENDFRLFANVELGKDVSLRDLREAYDIVVLATGSPKSKKLGIKGEDLLNCLPASSFVSWYNGHPDFSDLEIDFNCDTAIVIGAGNVAIDVARILVNDPSELERTDIAEHALKSLKSSSIRKVIVCGRRGPEHAAFTLSELRELPELDHVDVIFDNHQLNDATTRVDKLGVIEKDIRLNILAMKSIAESRKKGLKRNLEFRFLANPVEIRGSQKVEEVLFSSNEIAEGKIRPSGQYFSINSGLVVTAIGYESEDNLGLKVDGGRIVNIAGHVEHNVYVTGWAKRGPVGVIGTNKSDSADVVQLIIQNLKAPKNCAGIVSLLRSDHKVINQVGWDKINASEVIAGELSGKPRQKEVDWNRLINLGTIS